MNAKSSRLAVSVLTAFVLAFAAQTSSAQAPGTAFPSKPVRITSPFPTGLTPDVTLRMVAEKLARGWNQPVIVEARPGGNGLIAIGAMKKAAADGHEMLLLTNAHLSINPHLLKAPPYDPEADFAPVSTMFRAPFFLVVSATGPYKTIQDLIAAARANPGRITYSSPSVGSVPHLGGAMLAYLTGTQMTAVHFKEGAPMFTTIVNGDVSFIVSTAGSAAALIKAGKLRYLAAVRPTRHESEPEVPTVREVGGPPQFEVETWGGVVAPKAVPADVIRRLGADFARALAEADIRERFRALGFEAKSSAPAEMAALMRSESVRYGELVKKIGITPD